LLGTTLTQIGWSPIFEFESPYRVYSNFLATFDFFLDKPILG